MKPVLKGRWTNADLREVLRQAAVALNKVEISECIRSGMLVATAPCDNGDVERLGIKEEACHYLAVALLQGYGRLDEAILWWRERKRIADAIVQHELSSCGAVLEPRTEIFDRFWSGHIGHTALLGVHVKRNLLEGPPYRSLALVRAPSPGLGNRYLANKWHRYFTLADHGHELPPPFAYFRHGCKNIYLEDRPLGPDAYYWQPYAEISQAWEAAAGGPLLELSPREIERGVQALSSMGVPRGAWYVCLHVRSRGFKVMHEGLQDSLNAAIRSYDLAIGAIVDRGGWVIRMGDPSMPKLPPQKQVIDYAHSSHKADWLDIFLCATCRFYIGTSSGLAYVPNLFSTPSLFTNWFPTGTRPLNGTDLFIPKLHWYEKAGEYAPFAESLAPPLGHIHALSTLRQMDISLKDNTREDLRDVVLEMLDRLEGTAVYTTEDKAFQACFEAVCATSRCFGNAKIGRDFVRKHRSLLPRLADTAAAGKNGHQAALTSAHVAAR